VDWLIKWGVVLVVSCVGATGAALLGADPFARSVGIPILAVMIILLFVFFLGFDIYFEVRHNGQTPGKMVAAIRVIRERGGPLDFRSAVIRNLLGLADFMPSFYLLGALLIFWTERSQRLGDLAAGTFVVRERGARLPEEPLKEVEHFASDEYQFTAEQLQTCTGEDRQVLRSFFRRYRDMERLAREDLADRLCDLFAERLSYPLSREALPEAFLASLYRELEKHKAYTS
jgi:uncharacterized RDD family membrane protein YckC